MILNILTIYIFIKKCVSDIFRCHGTEKVKHVNKENNCVILRVSYNMADQFQPLDLNVNPQVKQFLKSKFECWKYQHISKQLDDGSKAYDTQKPLKLSVIK